MGFIGRLFGTEKAIDNLTKSDGLLAKAGSWVGGLNYTEEEKAEADKETREWGLRQLEALAPFKVVQRIIALTVSCSWAFLLFNIIVGIWVEAIWPHISVVDKLMALAFCDFVLWPILAVLSLYFTGGVMPRKDKS